MKKIVGLILALCMLCTVASAATVTGSATASDLTGMTVTVTYAGLASDAQATLFAYKVADTATATAIPAYVDETTTPIVGIDQEAADGTFTFKVASTFRGKIAVKIGGTDVETPVAFLVEFKDAVSTLSIKIGDVDGNGVVNSDDATLLKGYTSKVGNTKKAAYNETNSTNCGKEYTSSANSDVIIKVGDVNGDGVVNSDDATLLKGYTSKVGNTKKAAYNETNSTNCGTDVTVIAE